MIWKSFAMLTSTVVVLVIGVVGLARVTVVLTPDFAAGLAGAADAEDGSFEFTPNAMGAEIEVTGAREGTMSLDQTLGVPSFGLGGNNARIFFTTDPLAISQMSYDGLEFFPDPDVCVFTSGEVNEDIGVIAVHIRCDELTDIRDNGTIAIDGYAGFPVDMVIELDLPDLGGTVTVGNEIWEITGEPGMVFGGSGPVGQSGDLTLALYTDDPERAMWFSVDTRTALFDRASILLDGEIYEFPPGSCSIGTEDLAVANPQYKVVEMTFVCPEVEIGDPETVGIEGQVVVNLYTWFEG